MQQKAPEAKPVFAGSLVFVSQNIVCLFLHLKLVFRLYGEFDLGCKTI
jgi:hypothetical protein